MSTRVHLKRILVKLQNVTSAHPSWALRCSCKQLSSLASTRSWPLPEIYHREPRICYKIWRRPLSSDSKEPPNSDESSSQSSETAEQENEEKSKTGQLAESTLEDSNRSDETSSQYSTQSFETNDNVSTTADNENSKSDFSEVMHDKESDSSSSSDSDGEEGSYSSDSGSDSEEECSLAKSDKPANEKTLIGEPGSISEVEDTSAASDLTDNKNPISSIEEEDEDAEPDELYRLISLEMKGHDKAVLNSYVTFITTAAQELSVNCKVLHHTETPKTDYFRKSLLKSIHIYKSSFVQYEIRTYYRVVHLKYLTGSSASIVLEYFQRNLPEGVAMKVSKHRLERLPEHLVPLEEEKMEA